MQQLHQRVAATIQLEEKLTKREAHIKQSSYDNDTKECQINSASFDNSMKRVVEGCEMSNDDSTPKIELPIPSESKARTQDSKTDESIQINSEYNLEKGVSEISATGLQSPNDIPVFSDNDNDRMDYSSEVFTSMRNIFVCTDTTSSESELQQPSESKAIDETTDSKTGITPPTSLALSPADENCQSMSSLSISTPSSTPTSSSSVSCGPKPMRKTTVLFASNIASDWRF